MSLSNFFNKTAVFKSVTKTADAYGGSSEVESTIKTVPCSIRPLSGAERAYRESINVLATHRIYCEYFTTAIAEKDKIYIGDTEYNIRLIKNPGGRDKHFEIDVEEQR